MTGRGLPNRLLGHARRVCVLLGFSAALSGALAGFASGDDGPFLPAPPKPLPHSETHASPTLAPLIDTFEGALSGAMGRMKFGMGGPIRTSEIEDGRIRVTFPQAYVAQESGVRLLLGDVTAWIRPHDVPHDVMRHDVTIDWPPRIELRDGAGNLTSVLTTGERHVFGQWRFDLGTFTRLELRLGDIVMTGAHAFRLDSLALDIAMSGTPPSAPVKLRLEWDGLTAANAGLPPEYVPESAILNADITGMPLRRLMAKAFPGSVLPSEGTTPERENAFADMLVESGTELRIADLSIRTPVWGLDATGGFSAQQIAAHNVVGRIDAEITGLDLMIGRAAKRSSGDTDATKRLAALLFLKVLGRRQGVADEGATYAYDVEIPPNGVLTVNGLPLDALGSVRPPRASLE